MRQPRVAFTYRRDQRVDDVVFDKVLVDRLLASAREGAPALERCGSAFVLAGDSSVARMLLSARDKGMLDGALSAIGGDSAEHGTGLLLPASTKAERRAATRAILRSTGKAVDGPLTRLFERRISQAITRVLLPLPLAGAYDYLGTIVFAKAEMLAFSDTFIVIGLAGLVALVPAAMLSRSQRRGRGFALLGKIAR